MVGFFDGLLVGLMVGFFDGLFDGLFNGLLKFDIEKVNIQLFASPITAVAIVSFELLRRVTVELDNRSNPLSARLKTLTEVILYIPPRFTSHHGPLLNN